MRIKKLNYYGFDHDKVNQMFSGGLTYLNDLCVNGEYHPTAVYRCKNPDKSKGHKKYVLLNGPPHNCVRGMTLKELNKWRYQAALHCLNCDDVIYSVNRHHMNECACKGIFIDGGKDYVRTGSNGKTKFEEVTIDLLLNKVKT